ncbi:MAG: N-acetylmuramoyl-L-alanine amidase [Flavobacteriaceae bacterium]
MLSQQNIKIYQNFKSHSFLLFLFLFALGNSLVYAQDTQFKVVLDAGHGGKDSGTVGLKSFKNVYEKDIALNVVLKIGKLLKKDNDIKTIYTRYDNTFVDLHKRGKIANKQDADLFISVHCNSAANKKAYGASTYVLGMGKTAKNLELAKKENDVMLMEDNYEKNYNYDPNSQEFLIGLTLMQEDYLDKSIEFAGIVQKKIKTVAKRKDRGVHQANFAVLYGSYMPSVLVEIGFLTNKNEERYLHTNTGQNKIAESIYKAILTYKARLNDNTIESDTPIENSTNVITTTSDSKNFYKIQIATSRKKIETKSYNFKGLQNIERVKVGNIYKYFYGVSNNFESAKSLRINALNKGYKDAFISKFKFNKSKDSSVYKLNYVKPKVKTSKSASTNVIKSTSNSIIYKVQISSSPKKLAEKSYNFKGLKGVDRVKIGKYYKYYYGESSNYETVKAKRKEALKKGFKGAFVVAFKNGKKVSVTSTLR